MELAGILLGLVAAVIQSVSFVASRRFIVKGFGSPVGILVLGHVVMGATCGVLLPFFWDPRIAASSDWIGDCLGTTFFYLAGQIGFMIALRFSESSRVTPLLALKMPAVAVVAMLGLGTVINAWQWVAVMLSVAAAFLLNRIGGSLPKATILGILFAVTNYAISDVYIIRLVDSLGEGFPAAARAVCLSYILCGLGAVLLLPWYGSRRREHWSATLPYAFAWLPSMFLFFASLAMIGPVLGNIVISTRGIWAIALGVLLAGAGQLALEQRVEKSVLLRRTAAAVMMIVAIGMYVYFGR